MAAKKQNISESTTAPKQNINHETTKENSDITKVICQEPSIYKILKEKTPNIAKLFKKNPIATLNFLSAIGKKYPSTLNIEISEETSKDLLFKKINEINNDDNQLLNLINANISEKLNEYLINKNNNSEKILKLI